NKKVINAQTSLGSQPQNLSQAICAQIDAKMRPPNANTGNPIATERYTTSSTKSVLIFLKYGFTHAPTRLRIIKRAIIYNKPPTTTDLRTVFSLRAESAPFIPLGVVIKGSILSGVIVVGFFSLCTPAIGGI